MRNNEKSTKTHTRTINPALGLLGILGLLGFLGFVPQVFNLTEVLTVPSFFFFFAFFGFFGFYYEGKMSHTLIDERYRANAYRAEAIANKASLIIIVTTSVIAMSLLRLNTYDMVGILIAVIGIAFGLSVFLSQYLLYRFENEE